MFTNEQIQAGFLKLGLAAGELISIKPDTKKALGRFLARAAASGSLDEYIRSRLDWLEAHEGDIDRPAPIRAKSTVVQGQLEDDPPRASRRRR